MTKVRLDNLLVEKGLFPSREKAKSSIMAGIVFVNGQKVDKAGAQVAQDARLEVQGNQLPYVSRGGLKLEKAIANFDINFDGKTLLDVGASTGGFTDCALQNGAKKVYALDVGYGQLAWKLRQDPRVVNFERTNIRYVAKDSFDEHINIVTIDVAFISLEKVLPKVKELLVPGGELISLIKPQFEAGKDKVGKKGVVKDKSVHKEVIIKVLNIAKELGFSLVGLTFSPIKGPEGNIEYLTYFKNMESPEVESDVQEVVISDIVEDAHSELTKKIDSV